MSERKSRGTRRKLDGVAAKTNSGSQPTAETKDRFASGYDFLLINSAMSEAAFGDVLKATGNGNKKNKKLVLTVATLGGLANPAYRIGRYLQSLYEELTAFVPSLCKSAGTLLATSAHNLVISPFGEIGPLDVQLPQKDEIFGRRSGLTTRTAIKDLHTHAFELFETFMLQIVGASDGNISFKLAAEVAARVTGNYMAKLYEQINPDALAQDYRDLNVATEYCKRLNRYADNISEDSITRFVNEYPTHDFVIDLEEAKTLFKRVELPTRTLYMLMRKEVELFMRPTFPSPVVKMLSLEKEEIQDGAPEISVAGNTDADGSINVEPDGDARGATSTA